MISSFFDKISAPVKSFTYDKPQTPAKITGELLQKKAREVQVRISDSRVVHATLKQEIPEKPGQTVSIDGRNIEKMEVKKHINTQVEEGKKQEGKAETDKLLDRLQIKPSQESREALEALQKHGVELTRGNVMAFITSKNLLNQVMEDLNPEKALELMNKNIDLDRTSLQELAQLLKEAPTSKEGFSFLKWLGIKKEMTTEQAEKIATKIYGSKMGKDITDTIKALDRIGMTPSKNKIEAVQQVLDKVHALRDIREEALLEPLKGKVDATLDHLFKLNQSMVSGKVETEPVAGGKATSYRAYQGDAGAVQPLSSSDLERMEESIANQLRSEGLDVSQERMTTAKTFLKNSIPVTAETIERMEALKEAVRVVAEKLDPEKVAAMQKAGIQVEKTDVTEIARWLQEYETQIKEESFASRGEMTAKEKEAILKNLQQQIEKLGKMDEVQLLKLVRQGGDLKLSQLAPMADQGIITTLSETDQQVLKMAEVLGRLSDFSLEAAAHHQRQQAPMTLESLAQSQQIVAENPAKALPLESQTTEGIEKAQEAMEAYLVQRGASAHAVQQHGEFDAARALSLQQLPLTETRVAQLYELRGAVENLHQNLTVATVQQAVSQQMSPEQMSIYELEAFMNGMKVAGTPTITLEQGLERMEIFNILQQADPDTLAFLHKHQIPITAASLASTQALIEGNQTEDHYKQKMNIDTRTDPMTLPKELPKALETLISRHVMEMAPQSIQDQDALAEMKSLARAIIANEMPLNRENMQELMQIQRQLQTILQDPRGFMGTSPGTISPETTLQQIAQQFQPSSKESGEIQPEQMQRITKNLESMKALLASESRQNGALSLMVKNAIPVNLEEVRQTGLFLQNKNQMGHLLGELTDRLLQYSDKSDHPARQAALQLQTLMHQVGEQLHKGKPPAADLYRQIGHILQEAEKGMTEMNAGERESFGRSSEQLMNALQLQSQLNREDSVFQLPFMMNGEAKNLQMFFMNDQKGKKIDPEDMSILFNFDTENMGNLNIFLGVKYKKIVMKMGVDQEEDRQWMERFSNQLHETMEELGYEIKDFSFRVEEEQHTLTLADEVQKFRGLRSGILDLQI